jgi:hypothetical protein
MIAIRRRRPSTVRDDSAWPRPLLAKACPGTRTEPSQTALPGVGKHALEMWPLRCPSRFMVHVFAGNLPALLCTVLAKGDQLVLGVLAPILRADAGVQCDSLDTCYAFHGVSSASYSGLFETVFYPIQVAMFLAFKLPVMNMLFDTPSPKCECCSPSPRSNSALLPTTLWTASGTSQQTPTLRPMAEISNVEGASRSSRYQVDE